MSTMQFGEVGPDDDDLDLKPVQNETTILDALTKELKDGTDDDVKFFPIPERPAISLGFNCNIDFDMLQAWINRATVRKGSKKGNVNTLAMARMVLSQTSIGAMVNGDEVTKDGEAVPLAHEFWQQRLGVSSTAQVLKTLFKKDGHIITAMQKVLEEAGYGDVDFEAEDPLNEG